MKERLPKVAMVVDDNFPPDPRIENQCKALAALGYTIDLYCLTFTDEPPLEWREYVRIIRIPVPPIYRSLSALAYTTPLYHGLLLRKLRKVFRHDHYDVVHIHDMQIARTVFWMLRDSSVALVLDLHENRPEIMKYYEHVNSLKGKLLIYPSVWKKYEKKYMEMADKCLLVTEEAKQYYIHTMGVSTEKLMVLPNAVSRDFYEEYDRKEHIIQAYKHRFVLLYLGNTNERRGMRTVLSAMQLLKDEIPEVLFVCAGKSKSDPQWMQHVQEEGLEDHVELLGWQDFEFFPSFAEACDIGLCPLDRNLHHDTTLANKLFQYMAFSKPVIVSDCTAQADLVERNEAGLVFETGDPLSLKQAVLKMYHDQEKARKWGENGYQLVQRDFLWEKIVSRLSDLYHSLT